MSLGELGGGGGGHIGTYLYDVFEIYLIIALFV